MPSGSITSTRRSMWAGNRAPGRAARRRRRASASPPCSSAAGAPPASATAVPRSSNDSCRSSSPSFSDFLPNSALRSSSLRCSSRRTCSAISAFSASSRAASASAARRAARSRSRAASAAETTAGGGEPAVAGTMGVALGMTPIWGESPPRRHRIIPAAHHSAASGRRTARARTRRQSRPSNNASNWPLLSRIIPSSIPGQAKRPCSRRL